MLSVMKKLNPSVPPRQSIFISLVYEDTLSRVLKNFWGLILVSLPWTTIGPFLIMAINKGKPNPFLFSLFPLITAVMIAVYFREEGQSTGKRVRSAYLGSWRYIFQIIFSFMIATAPIGVVVAGAAFLAKLLGAPGMLLLILAAAAGLFLLLTITPFIIPVFIHESGKPFNPFRRILFLIRRHKLRILLSLLPFFLLFGMTTAPLFMTQNTPPTPPAPGQIVLFSLLQLILTIFFNSLQIMLYYHARSEAGEDYPEWLTGPTPGEKII